jgi:predicted metal-binding membrane protein
MASIAQTRIGRVQLGVIGMLLVAAALAWVLTRERMLGMDAGPGTALGGLGFYVVSWVVMMAAMMFPSIAPMVLTFAFVQRRRIERGAFDRVVSNWTFIAGYLITWTAFGLAAYGLFVGVRSLSIPALSWHRGGPYLAGSVLLVAAAYQLSPAKDACLGRCRGTFEFVTTQWREGPWGALRMGIVHGAWCVGCCWALMASLFALGVMSLTWMIVIAGLIAVEKLLPGKLLANRTVALALVLLGIGVAFAPNDMPGLTVPGSPAAARAMERMGMHSGAMPGMSMHKSEMHSGAMPGMNTPKGEMHSGAIPGTSTHKSEMHSSAMPGTSTHKSEMHSGAMPGMSTHKSEMHSGPMPGVGMHGGSSPGR